MQSAALAGSEGDRPVGGFDWRRLAWSLVALIGAALWWVAPAAAAADAPGRLITPGGVGPLQLGMTLDAARAAAPGFVLQEDLTAAGVAFVAVFLDERLVMRLFPGEDMAATTVDWTAAVDAIEVVGPEYRTAAAIGPQSSLAEASQAYGGVVRIRRSDIDRREYALFDRQPMGLAFRVDGGTDGSEAGIYLPGTDMTDRVRPGARIAVVVIAEPPE